MSGRSSVSSLDFQGLWLVEDAVRLGAAGVGPGVENLAGGVVDDGNRTGLRRDEAFERDEGVLAVRGKPLVAADPVAGEADEAGVQRVRVHQRHLRDRAQPDDERLAV